MLKATLAAALVAASSFFAPAVEAKPSNCWILEYSETSSMVDPFRCDVTKRVNANGHTVYDITHFQGAGAQFTVVLWDDQMAEVIFKDGKRYEFEWYYDSDKDTRLILPDLGHFVF